MLNICGVRVNSSRKSGAWWRLVTITALAALLPWQASKAVPVQTPPLDAGVLMASLQEVGRGKMEWLWFDLYRARLMTQDGSFQADHYPQLLDIEYYRDIDSSDLINATKEQWQHLQFSELDIQRWLEHLESLWPNVNRGDHLSFVIIDAQTSQFFYNAQPLAIIHDENFATSFLAIWLSKKTSRPGLRANLLGESPCDC